MNSRFRLRPRNRPRLSKATSRAAERLEKTQTDGGSSGRPNTSSKHRRRLDEHGTQKQYQEPFWIQDPRVLCTSFVLLPSPVMTEAQRFNAMTRLILIITIFLFFIPLASWILFLICGIILLVILYSLRPSEQHRLVQKLIIIIVFSKFFPRKTVSSIPSAQNRKRKGGNFLLSLVKEGRARCQIGNVNNVIAVRTRDDRQLNEEDKPKQQRHQQSLPLQCQQGPLELLRRT